MLSVAIAASGACSVPDSGLDDEASNVHAGASRFVAPHMAEYERLAEQYPAFAGMYRADDGVLVLRFKGDAGADSSGIMNVAHAPDLTVARRVEGAAEYSYHELQRARAELLAALSPDDHVSWVTIDWRMNRLAVAFPADAARERFARRLRSISIPEPLLSLQIGAQPVSFQAQPTLQAQATLASRIRPLQSGTQIGLIDYSGWPSLCTMGPQAIYNGQRGFLTASHCTREYFLMNLVLASPIQPTRAYQNAADTKPLGTFVRGPHWYPCSLAQPGLVVRFTCIYADAAFVSAPAHLVVSQLARAKIRKPTGTADILLSTGLALTIVGVHSAFSTGLVLDKVGMQSGWTFASVVDTCRDIVLNDDGKILVCQVVVQGNSGPTATNGDSGAPVFVYSPSGSKIAGVLSGGLNGAPWQWWFTPVSTLQAEFPGISFVF